MKIILAVVALAALGGCAVQQQPYYVSRPVVDPYQWHTVAVTPSDRVAGSAGSVQYTTEPLPAPMVYSAPVYSAPSPLYAPAPVYYAPAPAYYYPPVSIGLDFVVGNWCCGSRGGWGGRGHHRRR
ncbi:MAG: hypothetical protein ACEQSK_20660 [Sphingomonadaceae bacterium]